MDGNKWMTALLASVFASGVAGGVMMILMLYARMLERHDVRD